MITIMMIRLFDNNPIDHTADEAGGKHGGRSRHGHGNWYLIISDYHDYGHDLYLTMAMVTGIPISDYHDYDHD